MPAVSPPATIVITIDGLSCFMLGLQGNTSVETIAFDTLATQGISFDFAFSPSCDLATALRAMMTDSNGDAITEGGVGNSFFVSDCPTAIATAESARFDSIIEVPLPTPEAAAGSVAETRAAEFFAVAIEALGSLEEGDLLWLHFSGLSTCWDAPLTTREHYRAPDDPAIYEDATPPSFTFDADVDDPDLLVSVQQACYAQVTIIDGVLDIFLDHVAQHPVGQAAVMILAGTRGYSLGDHGYVGIGKTLHSPSLHVPLLVKLAKREQSHQNLRSHSLIQTSAIGDWITAPDSIIDHCKTIMPTDSSPIFFSDGGDMAIQTAMWKLIRCVGSDSVITESLFAKPDDRWEVNDVARRCPQIIDELDGMLRGNDVTLGRSNVTGSSM